MVPASRERRGGVRSFIGRAGSAGAAALSQPGHRKTPEARTTATVAAKAAAEVTAQKTFPTLVFVSSSLSFAQILALALSSSLQPFAPSLPIDLSALRARW